MQPQTEAGEYREESFLVMALQAVTGLVEALRQGQSAESVLGALPDAAFIKSNTGQVLYANAMHLELFTPEHSPVGKTGTAYLAEDMMAASRLTDALIGSHCHYVMTRQQGHDATGRAGEFLNFKHSLRAADHPAFNVFGITRLVKVLEESPPTAPSSLASQWDKYQTLSETDRVMAKYLAQGYSPREVAGILNVSPRQVELRRKGILAHFGLPSPTQLTILFVRFQDRGFLDFGL